MGGSNYFKSLKSMNIKEKYSDEEWSKVAYLPLAIGKVMAMAGSDGEITSNESLNLMQTFIKARDIYKETPLIMDILCVSDNIQKMTNNAMHLSNLFSIKVEEEKLESIVGIRDMVLKDSREVLDLLKSKEDSKTIDNYKKWLLNIASKVANASKDGSNFLGFGGVRVNKEEIKFFNSLKEALE